MAGDAALDTVNALIALDAETLAQQTAQHVADVCHYSDAIVLAIAVRSTGLWTDRVATEVDERVSAKQRVRHQGVISLWSREQNGTDIIAREASVEAVRVMWHAIHGVADTLKLPACCTATLPQKKWGGRRWEFRSTPDIGGPFNAHLHTFAHRAPQWR